MEEDSSTIVKQGIGAFKWIIWSQTTEVTNCHNYIFKTEDPVNLISPRNFEFWHVDAKFSSVFKFTIANGENIVILEETRLTLEMYSNRELYSRLGRSFCIIYDVDRAKGGSEAIVESIYSIMKLQQHHG